MQSPQRRPHPAAGLHAARAQALQAPVDAVYAGDFQHVPLQGMDALSEHDRRLLLEYRASRKIVLFGELAVSQRDPRSATSLILSLEAADVFHHVLQRIGRSNILG